MNTTLTDGAEVAWTDSGTTAEPLLLIHGGGLADWMTPLAAEPGLGAYRVIRMVRAGYTGGPVPAGLSIAGHAAHAAELLRRLDAAPAHVVAHSSGSAVALQLAADHPSSVRTLNLLEPPLVDALADPSDVDSLRAALGAVIGSAMAATARGDGTAAFDTFMEVICGPKFRTVMSEVLGDAVVDAAAAGSRNFFTGEIPAINGWTFNPAVPQPTQLIQGGDSPPPTHRLITHLAGLLPDASIVTIPGVNHLMPLTAPAELADAITDFCRSR